jgi:hypothetical protein
MLVRSYGEASVAFQRAFELEPNVEVMCMLASAEWKAGRANDAVLSLHHAVTTVTGAQTLTNDNLASINRSLGQSYETFAQYKVKKAVK